MEEYAIIRRKFLVEGLSQRQIAAQLGIARNTVAKYCKGNTYAGLRADYRRAASVMTPDVIRFIEQCLREDDLEPNKKQHHTAHRIYDRLVAEKGFAGAESTVRRIVRKMRGNLGEAYVPLALSSHYCFQMDFCNVRSGNEKGLVENLVGLARRNVLVPVPHADSIAELNGNLEQYCTRYIEKHTVTGRPGAVSKLLRQDREKLLPLPGRPYDVRATDVGRISPYATLRFQTNAYSVPVKYVGQEATLKASAEDVAIYVDGKIVATHSRCYQKHKQVLALSHYLPLLERKPRSIAQALPVRQNLNPAMLTLLNTTNFSAKDLVDILRLCAEQGEDAFWKNEIEFLERPARPVCINDTVSVDEVDLSRYDHFLEGGNALCRMQA